MEQHRVGQLHQVSMISVPILSTYLWTDRQTDMTELLCVPENLYQIHLKYDWFMSISEKNAIKSQLINILCPTYNSDASWFNGDLVSIL